MHDVDREMHLIGPRFEARGDRIQTRLQFRQHVDEFLRRPFDRRMFDEEIDHLHAPEVSVELLFPFGLKEVGQQRRGTGAFRHRLQKLRGRLGDPAIAQQRFAQSRFPARTFHRLIAVRAERLNDFVGQRRVVGRPDRHRVADFVVQAPTGQIDFKMTRVFIRAFAAEAPIYDELARKGIGAGVR